MQGRRIGRSAVITTILAIGCSSAVAAHDFWIAPNAYWVAAQTITPLTLLVGHGPARQRSPIPLRRIIRFEAVGSNGARADIRARLRLGSAAADGNFGFKGPGAYMLALQTDDQAEIHLPAIRFNDYLRAEGLTLALEDRARRHRTDADGAESYSRCAKSLIQVGAPRGTTQNAFTRPVGLPLEIVPLVNPYAIRRRPNLPVQVIYYGRPLAGALIMLTRLENDAVPLETHRTDANGRATFALAAEGSWLLNVVWTHPQPPSRETDYETIFSSLSFGYPPGQLRHSM
jgi:uncharacterized GH25 family protein